MEDKQNQEAYRKIEENIISMREDNASRQRRLRDACSLEEYRHLVCRKGESLIWTRALQAALREHEIVRIPSSENPYDLDDTVIVPSNRRIEAQGATLRLATGVSVAMLKNEHTPDGTLCPVPAGCREENIAVVGGRWEDWRRERAGYGASGRYDAAVRTVGQYFGISTLFLFTNCDALTISDVTFAHASSFAVQSGDSAGHIYENIWFEDCYADGIHLNGNLQKVHVKNVRGKVGDDLVALNAYDWLNSSCNFGPQKWILCEDLELCLQGGKGYPAIRIQPAKFRYADGSVVDCSVSHVIFRRVKGILTYKMYLQTPPYKIGTSPEWAEVGTGGYLFFEDLEIDLTRPIDNIHQYRDSDPLRGHFAAFEFGADLSAVTLRNVRIQFHLDKYPLAHLITVGPKSILTLPSPVDGSRREVFDPYLSCHIDSLSLENVRVLGDAPAELIHLTEFHDVNQDGRSSGRGTVGRICKTD